MVALVGRPLRWAAAAIASQSSESALVQNRSSWTRSENTSAPPPGNDSSPASRRSAKTSSMGLRATLWIWAISIMVKALRWASGRAAFIARSRSR